MLRSIRVTVFSKQLDVAKLETKRVRLSKRVSVYPSIVEDLSIVSNSWFLSFWVRSSQFIFRRHQVFQMPRHLKIRAAFDFAIPLIMPPIALPKCLDSKIPEWKHNLVWEFESISCRHCSLKGPRFHTNFFASIPMRSQASITHHPLPEHTSRTRSGFTNNFLNNTGIIHCNRVYGPKSEIEGLASIS